MTSSVKKSGRTIWSISICLERHLVFTQRKTPVAVEITQAIERLERVLTRSVLMLLRISLGSQLSLRKALKELFHLLPWKMRRGYLSR